MAQNKSKKPSQVITLVCSEDGKTRIHTKKNVRKHKEKMERRAYNRNLRKHTKFVEQK
jgi:ribosomal protein L33